MTRELMGSDLKTYLCRLGACQEAIDWVGDRDLTTAWAECQRADWMLWFVDCQPHSGAVHRKCARVAVDIARKVLHLVLAGEDRPARAIEAAEAWLAGTGSAYAAHAASADAAVAAANAANAANAATSAASARAAAYAARAAADASTASAYAAYAAARDADATNAAVNTDAAYADIVRRHFPTPPEVQ